MATMNEEARTKLKAIMSAKLVEMVGHCESELPDYVVSMISNNKSKDYMRNNLVLFIGDHAEAFSEWLSELKDKIYQERSSKTEVATPATLNSSDEVKIEQKKVKKITMDTSADDNDKTTRKRKRIEYDIKDENRKSRSDRRDKHDDRKRSHSRDRTRKTSRKESPQRRRRERSKTWSDNEFGDPIPAGTKIVSSANTLPHESSHPKSKIVTSVTVLTPEPSSPKSKVASTVTVPSADPAVKAKRLMANESDKAAKTRSNIFFKAMSEASRADNFAPKLNKNNVRVDVGGTDMDDDESIIRAGPGRTSGPSVRVRLDLPNPPNRAASQAYGDASEKVPLKRKIVWDLEESETSTKKEKQVTGCSSRSASKATTSSQSKAGKLHYIDDQENEAAIDAFIAATNLEIMMRGKSDNDDEEINMPDDDEPSSKLAQVVTPDVPLSVSAVVEDTAKPKKRCAFWPACMKGQECEYIHPAIVCSKFPRCAFGQQCLYIHPPCKFGSMCRNANCGAVHGTPESLQEVCKLLGISAPVVPSKNVHLKKNEPIITMDVVQKPFPEIPCRFRNMCKNPNCIFKHPAECRFGRDCQMNACSFRHPDGKKPATAFPEAAKYKWKATA